MKNTPIPFSICIGFIAAVSCLPLQKLSLCAQGDLNPPASPAATQRSLEEIWTKLDNREVILRGSQEDEDKLRSSIETAKNTINDNQLTSLILLEAIGVPFAWTCTTVDSEGDVGRYTSLAFSPQGYPAISYYDYFKGNLKFAQFNGSSWDITTVDAEDDVGEYTSLAFSPQGYPAISYYDLTNEILKFAQFNGATWDITTVDSGDNVGYYTSLAFSPQGYPAISYHEGYPGYNLRFAIFNGSTWDITIVDSTDYVGEYTSLAFSPQGYPVISYYDRGKSIVTGLYNKKDLKLAQYNGATWDITTVDSEGDVGEDASLAFSPQGYPAISYYDDDNDDLKFAQFNATDSDISWDITTVDSADYVGEYTSLAFSPQGYPAISYNDKGQLNSARNSFDKIDLKFAQFNGSTWDITTVDSECDVGSYTSLAFSPQGYPAISYRDITNKDLRFAIRKPFSNP